LSLPQFARLCRIEPKFVEFLKDYRQTVEYRNLEDGDLLFERFDEVGFGGLFYAPSVTDWDEIRCDKIPNLDAPLTQRIPRDTLYSLFADADFEKHQEEMDREIKSHIEA